MICTYEVVSVYVCPYCSHDNEAVGPCARCGLAGNPSKTPWGIKDNRHTKYWHKYNWQAQPDYANYQERANAENHQSIMKEIRPKKIQDAKFLSAGVPAIVMPKYDIGEDSEPTETPLPDPIKGEEKTEEEIEEILVDWENIIGNAVGSKLILDEKEFTEVGGRYQLFSKPLSIPRYEFSLPPRILSEEGQWSLLDPVFKGLRNINNNVTKTKDQGQHGTCAAFAVTDSAEWLSGRDYAAMYSAAVSYINEGHDIHALPNPRGENGVWESNTMISTDLNGGKLPLAEMPTSNSKPIWQYYIDNGIDNAKIGELRSNTIQPSIPSTPDRWNATIQFLQHPWATNPVHIEKEYKWALLCSQVHAGMVSTLGFDVRKDVFRLNGQDHYTPTAPHVLTSTGRKCGHAVTVWGVKVTKNVSPQVEDIFDTNDNQKSKEVINNPFFDTKASAWKAKWRLFSKEANDLLRPLDKTIGYKEVAIGRRGELRGTVLEMFWNGKPYRSSFKKHHPEVAKKLKDLENKYLSEFRYELDSQDNKIDYEQKQDKQSQDKQSQDKQSQEKKRFKFKDLKFMKLEILVENLV